MRAWEATTQHLGNAASMPFASSCARKPEKIKKEASPQSALTAVATAVVVRLSTLSLDTLPLTRSADGVTYRGTWRGVEVAAVTLSDSASLDRSALLFHRAGGRKPLNRPSKRGDTVVLGTSEE